MYSRLYPKYVLIWIINIALGAVLAKGNSFVKNVSAHYSPLCRSV